CQRHKGPGCPGEMPLWDVNYRTEANPPAASRYCNLVGLTLNFSHVHGGKLKQVGIAQHGQAALMLHVLHTLVIERLDSSIAPPHSSLRQPPSSWQLGLNLDHTQQTLLQTGNLNLLRTAAPLGLTPHLAGVIHWRGKRGGSEKLVGSSR